MVLQNGRVGLERLNHRVRRIHQVYTVPTDMGDGPWGPKLRVNNGLPHSCAIVVCAESIEPLRTASVRDLS